MPLSDEVSNRIARKVLVHVMVKQNIISDQPTMKRELPNMAREINEDPNDLLEFTHELVPELIAKKYGLEGIIVKWGNKNQQLPPGGFPR